MLRPARPPCPHVTIDYPNSCRQSLLVCQLCSSLLVFQFSPRCSGGCCGFGQCMCLCVSVVGKECACLANTYNQLKRLWVDKDKALSQHPELHPPSLHNSNSSLGLFTFLFVLLFAWFIQCCQGQIDPKWDKSGTF